MNSEKVKEIKKDIEICMKSLNCNGCSYKSSRSGECCKNLTNDILTLINELESENDTLHTNLCEWRKENAELKDRIAELEKENDEKYKRIMELEEDLVHADENVFYRECNVALNEKEIKAEALKQFAERLIEKKVKLGDRFNIYDIDETLKECLCEK